MAEPKAHILVVDDDDRLRSLLKKFLRDQQFMVTTAADVAEARRKLAWFMFDLIILDVMMPGESGFDLLASLPEDVKGSVLMLSAMGDADDRVRGLENGAEDYIVKPFEPKELVLRIKTILRRKSSQPEKSRFITFGGYRFDFTTSQLKRGAENIYLTSNEMSILKLLAENSGKPVSREELSKLMPGAASERTVDVQITRLRKKIEESEGKPVYLQTVRGAGYVLYTDVLRVSNDR
jgi:two-component system phosphate regulon response regulator OmpR